MSKSPSLRRIQADIRELSMDPSDRYTAAPLENDMFEWHFTIQGAEGTDFEGGVYHGRILLPAEYPFKPPNIVFLTPNGRFETGKKVCLSFSAYHPELWQPAWGIRLILEALISFLPTPGDGAIGALDWSSKERQRLAKASVEYSCPMCGNCHAVLEGWRKKMEHKVKKGKEKGGGENRFQKEIEQLHALQVANEGGEKQTDTETNDDDHCDQKEAVKNEEKEDANVEEDCEVATKDEEKEDANGEEDCEVATNDEEKENANVEEDCEVATKDKKEDANVEKDCEVATNDSSKHNSETLVTTGPLDENEENSTPSTPNDDRNDSEVKNINQLDTEKTQEETATETKQEEESKEPVEEELAVNNEGLETPWISDPVIHTGIVVLSIIIYLLVRKIQAIIVEMKELEAQFR